MIETWLKIPKVQMGLALIIIFLSAFLNTPNLDVIKLALLAVIGCVGFDYLFWKIRKIPPFLPSAALVTGLIIALLAAPTLPWYVILSFCFIAIAVKNYLRIDNKHLLNPAASGLFLGGLIFQQPVSWWATSFQQFNLETRSVFFFLILLVPAWVSFIKMKRYRIILSFLIIYGLVNIFRLGNITDFSNIRLAFLDPTVLFFALVMLPEPRTSPNDFKWQLFFGGAVGILALVFSQPIFSSLNFLLIPDPLITALLVANLCFFRK